MAEKKKTVQTFQNAKLKGERISMLTAYDFTTATLLDEAGVDSILVGDSLGMVMLGYENTLQVTMDDMIHHTRAVARGTANALLIGDMPFLSYQVSVEDAESADEIFTTLMGDKVEPRRDFIQNHALEVSELDI